MEGAIADLKKRFLYFLLMEPESAYKINVWILIVEIVEIAQKEAQIITTSSKRSTHPVKLDRKPGNSMWLVERWEGGDTSTVMKSDIMK